MKKNNENLCTINLCFQTFGIDFNQMYKSGKFRSNPFHHYHLWLSNGPTHPVQYSLDQRLYWKCWFPPHRCLCKNHINSIYISLKLLLFNSIDIVPELFSSILLNFHLNDLNRRNNHHYHRCRHHCHDPKMVPEVVDGFRYLCKAKLNSQVRKQFHTRKIIS